MRGEKWECVVWQLVSRVKLTKLGWIYVLLFGLFACFLSTWISFYMCGLGLCLFSCHFSVWFLVWQWHNITNNDDTRNDQIRFLQKVINIFMEITRQIFVLTISCFCSEKRFSIFEYVLSVFVFQSLCWCVTAACFCPSTCTHTLPSTDNCSILASPGAPLRCCLSVLART